MNHSKCAKYILWTLYTGFISITCIMWLKMSMQPETNNTTSSRNTATSYVCRSVCLSSVLGGTVFFCFYTSQHFNHSCVWLNFFGQTVEPLHWGLQRLWAWSSNYEPNHTGKLHAVGLKMNATDSRQPASPFFPPVILDNKVWSSCFTAKTKLLWFLHQSQQLLQILPRSITMAFSINTPVIALRSGTVILSKACLQRLLYSSSHEDWLKVNMLLPIKCHRGSTYIILSFMGL